MDFRKTLIIAFILANFFDGVSQNDNLTPCPVSTRMIWFDEPATLWTDAIPIGNGRLGAMVYGRTHEETLQLNESSIWAGGPYNSNGEGGYPFLDSIRNLVFQKRGKEAEDLFEQSMMARSWGTAPYQPLGNLKMIFPGHSRVENYRRELIMDSAIARVSYSINGVEFTRTIFCSHPDDVLVIKLEASRPGAISCLFQLEGMTNPRGGTDEEWKINHKGNNKLILSGTTRSFKSSDQRLHYEGQLIALPDGGEMETIFLSNNPMIRIRNANTVLVYFTAASSFKQYNDVTGDPYGINQKIIESTIKRSYSVIERDHINDFSSLFNRVSLSLSTDDRSKIPTSKRFLLFAEGNDPNFAALFFQYGRYLMISCSRPGGIPANLQGLWNQDMSPAWNGGYTTNINFEMNYWPSDVTNLFECREPQLEMIKDMAKTGQETARLNFNADGWVFNLNTDIWLASAPIYGAYWGSWHTAAAWFCDDLWEHFLFTCDTAYLSNYYPLIRDATLFFDQTLVMHPEYGWLVTNPSSSPENGPGGDLAWTYNPDGSRNRPIGICAGSTCDNALVGELFQHFIEASKLLGKDMELRQSVTRKLKLLPPYQIGRYGQLQEWLEDVDHPDDKHRHTSHLWGLHPGTSIDLVKTPDLADAAKVVLEHRGDESTGWALAWRTMFWARLKDGNRAYKLFSRQLQLVDSPEYKSGPGGTYLNLMDAHPPYQIDGNFGSTAALAEMIIQSHNGYLEFLPALPDAWENGSISGVRARGGFEISIDWDSGKWKKVIILSDKGLPCIIRSNTQFEVWNGEKKMHLTRISKDQYKFSTQKGIAYILKE